MEDLACQIGLPNLDRVIEGCFKPVKLKGRIPHGSLEFYQKVMEWFPDHLVFISGGYASYVMGLKSNFVNVDIYVICEKTGQIGDVLHAIRTDARNKLKCEIIYPRDDLRRGTTNCEYEVWSIADKPHNARTESDIDVDIVGCMPEYHGLKYDENHEPIGWKRYAELEESGHVPKSKGRYRYVEMLEAVMHSDIFKSMCIIDSVDLKNGQCSAMALHQFQNTIADIDLKSLYADRQCDKYKKRLDEYCERYGEKKRSMSVSNATSKPDAYMSHFLVSDVCRYKYLTDDERERHATVMLDFWRSMERRYEQYRYIQPDNTIVIPSLSNLSLGKMLTETRDLDKYYEGQKPIMLKYIWKRVLCGGM